MNQKILTLVVMLALLPFSRPARAAVINYAGAQTDLGSGWRTSTVTKPFDIDGNNVLGTDGYYLVNLPPQQPAYISQMAILTSTSGGDPSYAFLDDPTDPTNLFQSGAMNPFPGPGAGADLFSFTMNSALAGQRIRVGLMVDNLDNAGFNAASLELAQTNGAGTASASVDTTGASFNNRVPDWVFFDIIAAAAGDTFVVRGTGGPAGGATLGGVSFDSREPLVVTNLSDSGPGTLRAIVNGALMAGDTIQFAADLSGQTITLTNGPVMLSEDVTIDASTLPAGLTLSGGRTNQIFNVLSNANVSLLCLTLSEGIASDTGGAIYSSIGSSLNVARCTFTGNTALEGGAILSDGTLQVENSTFSGNYGSFGGAIECHSPTTVTHCTISANNSYACGGIYSRGSTLTVNNSIIAGNTTTVDTQDIYSQNAALQLTNANLIQGIGQDSNSPPAAGPAPITNAPLLAPLGNHGGPTPTMPPNLGSPAIDAGGPTALTIDQRGFPRVFGAAPDLGAVELSYNATNAVVTTTGDSDPGSLRATVAVVPGGITISFAPNLSGQTITLTNGPMMLSEDVTIDASALPAGLTLSGGGSNQIFNVVSNANVSLTCLTLTQGNASDAGGAIYSSGGSSLNVARCTFTGNTALEGGAILNDGMLQVVNSTFSGNYGGFGGALQCRAPATLNQCTISANNAYACGGIYNKGSTLSVNNSIIAGNTDSVDAQDVYSENASLQLTSPNLIESIGQDNLSPPVTGPVPIAAVPLLAPLGNYGGPTPTMPALPGSPAIDAAAPGALTVDQRGFPRVLGIAPDLGAVEGVFNPAGPRVFTNVMQLGNGDFQFGFTNYEGMTQTVLATTNVALPLNTWSNLGHAIEISADPGQFRFTDAQATNYPQRFYHVTSP